MNEPNGGAVRYVDVNALHKEDAGALRELGDQVVVIQAEGEPVAVMLSHQFYLRMMRTLEIGAEMVEAFDTQREMNRLREAVEHRFLQPIDAPG
jgi:PHD/YefM family antitoxin component YafN of YafNO toxin-antitoxin module